MYDIDVYKMRTPEATDIIAQHAHRAGYSFTADWYAPTWRVCRPAKQATDHTSIMRRGTRTSSNLITFMSERTRSWHWLTDAQAIAIAQSWPTDDALSGPTDTLSYYQIAVATAPSKRDHLPVYFPGSIADEVNALAPGECSVIGNVQVYRCKRGYLYTADTREYIADIVDYLRSRFAA